MTTAAAERGNRRRLWNNGPVLTGFVFDEQQSEQVEDWRAAIERLNRGQLLWLALHDPTEEELAALGETLDLGEALAHRRVLQRPPLLVEGQGPDRLPLGERVEGQAGAEAEQHRDPPAVRLADHAAAGGEEGRGSGQGEYVWRGRSGRYHCVVGIEL